MPFDPLFPYWAGQLPVLQSARAIVERDFVDALAWRCSLDGSTEGDSYARIQHTQRHSEKYPLLIIQAAQSAPAALTGGVRQQYVFDCEIFLTRDVGTGNVGTLLDGLAADLIRYYDATVMCLLSADADDWTENFPTDSEDQGRPQVWCSNAIFGQLEESIARSGLYMLSVAFELQVSLTESE
jgi:hypothetical protein